MEKKKINLDESIAKTQNQYFTKNPNLFESKFNLIGTIIGAIITIICAGIAYVMWFQPELIANFLSSDTSVSSAKLAKLEFILTLIKWGSAIFAILGALFLLFGGASKFINRETGGEIELDYLVKYFSADHLELKDLFEKKNFEEILKIPGVSSYYNGIGELHTFRLAHDAAGKMFFAFLEYRHDRANIEGTVIHENLDPIAIREPEYSRLKPLVDQNIRVAKDIEYKK